MLLYMTALVIILVVAGLIVASVVGVDSRVDDERGWWPGRRAPRNS